MKSLLTLLMQDKIAEGIYKIVLQGDLAQETIIPGQFLHVKVQDSLNTLLRRPISICEVDSENKTITMIYRLSGKGTKVLSEKKPGELIDCLGPLGNGFPTNQNQLGDTVLLVGGGIGVPPLYELSRRLKQIGVKVIHVLGFQSSKNSFYINEFNDIGETHITTVDGTLGSAGYVTDILSKKDFKFDRLYACGPTAMLKAIEIAYPNQEIYLSLEERMGCGIGACFACVRQTTKREGKGYVKLCSDGPVFRAGEVIL